MDNSKRFSALSGLPPRPLAASRRALYTVFTVATVKTPLAGALVVALLLAPRPSSAEPPPAAPGQEPDPAPPAGRSASFSTTVSARRFSESELTSFSQEIVADERVRSRSRGGMTVFGPAKPPPPRQCG